MYMQAEYFDTFIRSSWKVESMFLESELWNFNSTSSHLNTLLGIAHRSLLILHVNMGLLR